MKIPSINAHEQYSKAYVISIITILSWLWYLSAACQDSRLMLQHYPLPLKQGLQRRWWVSRAEKQGKRCIQRTISETFCTIMPCGMTQEYGIEPDSIVFVRLYHNEKKQYLPITLCNTSNLQLISCCKFPYIKNFISKILKCLVKKWRSERRF